jgi:hypothetical protein
MGFSIWFLVQVGYIAVEKTSLQVIFRTFILEWCFLFVCGIHGNMPQFPEHWIMIYEILSYNRDEAPSSFKVLQKQEFLERTNQSESESESELLYYWRLTANQFILTPSSLRLTTSIFFFQLNLYSPYVISSPMRGWICRLQLLLAFASAVILGSYSRGTHGNILLSQIRGFPILEDQVAVFMSSSSRVAFSSPPTTRRITVEVFDP